MTEEALTSVSHYNESAERSRAERSRPALPKLWAMKVGSDVAESENYDISSPMR
jgi:hypothetical protein